FFSRPRRPTRHMRRLIEHLAGESKDATAYVRLRHLLAGLVRPLLELRLQRSVSEDREHGVRESGLVAHVDEQPAAIRERLGGMEIAGRDDRFSGAERVGERATC